MPIGNNRPLVSVIIAAYNCELFIEDAIASVLKQSYSNIELIIVDDCSTDNSLKICQLYAASDSRIFVFANDNNLGDYGNRNKAANLASGKYLKYLDHDDIIYPYSISLMVDFMEANPSASYGFSFRQVQDDVQPFPILFSPAMAFRFHFLNGGFFYAGPGSSIISKRHFDAVGGFSGKRFVGDYELWLKLSISYDCIIFQSGLIWWRIHPGQESQKAYYKHFKINLLSNFQLSIDYLNDVRCPLDPVEISCSKIIQQSLFCRNLLQLLFIRCKPFVFYELFSRSKIRLTDIIKSFFPVRIRLYIAQL